MATNISSGLAALKKNRASAIAELQKAAEALKKNNFGDGDEGNYWKPTRDKAGNGYAMIRFLPAPDGDELPWARYWDHGWQGKTGKWYIEKSLTSIGQQQDPCGMMNSELWKLGEEGQKIARDRKRRLHYVANILVISDPDNKENEGKVFLFKFGKKIFDKIELAMQPDEKDPDAVPFNPFDFWDGANFKLKIRTVENFPNYDQSSFTEPKPLFDDDSKIDAVYSQCVSLKEFTDPAKYKTYEELEKKLIDVLGDEAKDYTFLATRLAAKSAMSKAKSVNPSVGKTAKQAPIESDDDDDIPAGDDSDDTPVSGDANPDMDYFKQLASDDE